MRTSYLYSENDFINFLLAFFNRSVMFAVAHCKVRFTAHSEPGNRFSGITPTDCKDLLATDLLARACVYDTRIRVMRSSIISSCRRSISFAARNYVRPVTELIMFFRRRTRLFYVLRMFQTISEHGRNIRYSCFERDRIDPRFHFVGTYERKREFEYGACSGDGNIRITSYSNILHNERPNVVDK